MTVAEPDALSLEAGRFYNRRALRLYAECRNAGRWPGYDDGEVVVTSLPPYVQNRYFEESGL